MRVTTRASVRPGERPGSRREMLTFSEVLQPARKDRHSARPQPLPEGGGRTRLCTGTPAMKPPTRALRSGRREGARPKERGQRQGQREGQLTSGSLCRGASCSGKGCPADWPPRTVCWPQPHSQTVAQKETPVTSQLLWEQKPSRESTQTTCRLSDGVTRTGPDDVLPSPLR